MKKPSHLEMAGWGLLSLLSAAALARFADWRTGITSFAFFLPLAAMRASGRVDIIFKHYFYLVMTFFVLGGIGMMFFPIDRRVSHPVTLELLPALYSMMNPAMSDDRTVLFISSVWHALLCACVIMIPITHDRAIRAILRSVITLAIFIVIHLLVVRDRNPEEFTAEYKREVAYGAVIGIYTLMPVYAGFYVALFYDLVKASNTPANEQPRSGDIQ